MGGGHLHIDKSQFNIENDPFHKAIKKISL